MTPPYDLIVIGGGSAGYAAASAATREGLRVAVVEGGDEVGGLCILRGCMPSKTLLESGHRAEAIRRAGEFGLRADYHGADAAAIHARKVRLIREFAGYRREQLETGPFTFIRGRARFTDPHTLSVSLREGGTETLHGRTFLLATGSEIRWASVPGLREAGVWTSDDVLDADHLPKSVIILGAGPTGLEFASYYAGLGLEVTVVQRGSQILRGVDEDIAQMLQEGLEARGIRFFTKTGLDRVEKDGALQRVHFADCDRAPCAVEAEQIIYALGRQPATSSLALHHAGVELSSHGSVRIECNQQTTASHIFAAGDVCGPYEIVHLAVQQAEIAARNAARLLRGDAATLEEMDYTLKLFAVFTHPQVAMVGLSAREAASLNLPFAQASYPFAEHGKAQVRGETEGLVRLLAAGPDKKIIGAPCWVQKPPN